MTQVNFSFTEASSAEILLNPEAMMMLTEAAEGFGGMIHVKNLLSYDDDTKKKIVLVKYATKLLGCFALTFTEQEVGKVMTLVLLGGTHLELWKNELSKFLYETADKHVCKELYYMGRKGFARLFPQLEEIARVYRARRPDFDTESLKS